VSIESICEINPRRSLAKTRADNELTTFVPMPAVDDRNGIIARPEVKPYKEVSKGYTFFQEGDVLFAKITPCMQNGKHAIARNLIDGIGFGSTEFHVLRPGEQVIAEWLHFFLRQNSILEEAMGHFEGSVGQQRVPADFLRKLQIPLPPVAEQQRLVFTLQQQLVAADTARTAAEVQLATLRALPATLLKHTFQPVLA
jgi:type I restriction enzyme S subunit